MTIPFTLPRLDRLRPVVDGVGNPSIPFHVFWDQMASAIEDHETTQTAMLADIAAAQAAIIATQATLTTTVAALTAAQADILIALANMPDILEVVIEANYDGTIKTDQLPYVVLAQRFSGSTDQTTLAAWSFTVDSGALTATISNGALTITAITADSVVTISSVYGGITKSRTFSVVIREGIVPAEGTGGGSSAATSTFISFNSSTHAPVTNELTVTVGAIGTVTLNAPLTFYTSNSTPGSYSIFGKWQWWDGASWVDVASESVASDSCSVFSNGRRNDGTITINTSKTGLTAASSQKFRLEARNNVSHPTSVMNLAGAASAVSS